MTCYFSPFFLYKIIEVAITVLCNPVSDNNSVRYTDHIPGVEGKYRKSLILNYKDFS